MVYDENNIFAKILRGEIPCHKIYEDEDTLVFLDIMPGTEGHALVVTKEKARDLFDIKPEALAKLMAVVQKLAPKIKEAVGADGVLIQQFNGSAAGQTVFHLHVHIVPIKQGVPVKPHAGQMEDQAKLAATAQKIRRTLTSNWRGDKWRNLCHHAGDGMMVQMNTRTQITLNSEMQRQARRKAAELGISFAEYVRRLVARDLGSLRPRKADISILFDLIDEGPETNIARDKDKMIGDAVWDEHRRKTTRTRAHVRLKTKE